MFDITLVLESYAHAEYQTIRRLATHDSLTDLPNHNRLTEYLETQLSRSDAEYPLALLFIGINRFKAVNETLGHQAGNTILKEIAVRLKELLPLEDAVSRLGGDIFVIVAPNATLNDAQDLADAVINTLNKPWRLFGFSVDVTATIEAVLIDSAGESAANLMSRADMALYHAKQ
jgi:diguanylate cyclase (GGDEF)-like protein